ncbi:MAG: hypothetical protein O9284_10340 [Steroidobacteraceae bacterium]|nr:hypothetical protein [Steroidobacteraceae bacterium]
MPAAAMAARDGAADVAFACACSRWRRRSSSSAVKFCPVFGFTPALIAAPRAADHSACSARSCGWIFVIASTTLATSAAASTPVCGRPTVACHCEITKSKSVQPAGPSKRKCRSPHIRSCDIIRRALSSFLIRSFGSVRTLPDGQRRGGSAAAFAGTGRKPAGIGMGRGA